MKKLLQWINRQERREIKQLKARLRVSEELQKKTEQLAYKAMLALFESEEETPPPPNGLLS